MASENEETPRPVRRSVARHARPRLTVRRRMQVPMGRAIAITAMPTALLMGTLAPKLAFAATKAPQATTVADSTPSGDSCTKGSNTPSATPSGASAAAKAAAKAAKARQQQVGSAASSVAGAAASTAAGAASAAASPTQSGTKSLLPTQQPSASASATLTPTASPSASASSSGTSTDPITGLLNGLGGLLGLGHADTTSGGDTRTADSKPSASASASPTDSAPAAAPSSAMPTASSSAPAPASASATPSATASSSAAPSNSPSPSPSSTSTDPNKQCDISGMAAPLDSTNSNAIFPAESWTLHASTLKLTNSIFHGVVTVHTQGGDKRVLKFTATAIDIGDLDMSTTQRDQKLHVQGAKGSTSTMRNGTVTMYVEKLSGKLEAAEGLPLGILNVNLTLTPDTLPQWLYNLVGSVPIPLNMTLSGVEVIQAGQLGGDLTIPGMHLYYTTS
ncbi:hypothetical protein [Streptacidiphilus monticola]|uniref:DUF2993 domain-containing protein n=1 Tax=Streptacidiphilus monticola TaxID=2161674 RepID=A0ABW1G1F1_9ACTN